MKNIVLIGSGNLAEALARAISRTEGATLLQIFARNAKRGTALALENGTAWSSDPRELAAADLYILAVSDAAVVTSGTATLETALLGIPEAVVYRTVWWQVWLRPYVLKVPWVSLVNLNLGRECVAELIQSDLSVERAEQELRAIVAGGSKREKMLADFDELRTVIGGPGASDRFAARMVELLKKQVR